MAVNRCVLSAVCLPFHHARILLAHYKLNTSTLPVHTKLLQVIMPVFGDLSSPIFLPCNLLIMQDLQTPFLTAGRLRRP